MSKPMFYQGSVSFCKNEPEESEVLHLPHRIIIMSEIKNDSFTKRSFLAAQVRQIVRRPHKMASKNDL